MVLPRLRAGYVRLDHRPLHCESILLVHVLHCNTLPHFTGTPHKLSHSKPVHQAPEATWVPRLLRVKRRSFIQSKLQIVALWVMASSEDDSSISSLSVSSSSSSSTFSASVMDAWSLRDTRRLGNLLWLRGKSRFPLGRCNVCCTKPSVPLKPISKSSR